MTVARYLPNMPLASSSRLEMPMIATAASAMATSFVLPLRTARRSASLSSPSRRRSFGAKAEVQDSVGGLAADALAVKHVLLPITDRNPYLSEGTRQRAFIDQDNQAFVSFALIKVLMVIDEKPKETIPEHDAQLSSIRWHLSEASHSLFCWWRHGAGGFQEFGLMERLGEGKKPTAIIAEVADELNLDLVVLSMEAIHSKHVDGNLLAEFVPCPVLLLPL
ncbi:hypothetical protein QJS04_geneDACA001250 [Acorus gramineus]|uniref:UspA domain-containing protein n=1 Tax=Acorus gramineus TaxID=55184 RepID=A0AAV9AEN0_ACOGR|nr:hypothetical protein QJS04_geneDACA001250 [Acorus gramineus]